MSRNATYTKRQWAVFVLGLLPLSVFVLVVSGFIGIKMDAITFRVHFGNLENPTVGFYDLQFLGYSDPYAALLSATILILVVTAIAWFFCIPMIGSGKRKRENQNLQQSGAAYRR